MIPVATPASERALSKFSAVVSFTAASAAWTSNNNSFLFSLAFLVAKVLNSFFSISVNEL